MFFFVFVLSTYSETENVQTDAILFSNDTIINEVVKMTADDPDFNALFAMLGGEQLRFPSKFSKFWLISHIINKSDC